MRKEFIIAVLVLVALFTVKEVFSQAGVSAEPQADGSLVVHISAEVVAQCQAEGGCKIVTAKQVMDYIQSVKPQLCKQVNL